MSNNRCPGAKSSPGLVITQRTASIPAALLVAVVYIPATQCGYICDDDDYVENNETLRSADGLRRIRFEIGATR